MNGIIRKDGRVQPTRWIGNIHWVSLVGCCAAKAVVGSTTKYRVSTAILSSILMSPSPSPPISTTPTAKAKRPKPSRNGSLANVVRFFCERSHHQRNWHPFQYHPRKWQFCVKTSWLTSKVSFKQSLTLLFCVFYLLTGRPTIFKSAIR